MQLGSNIYAEVLTVTIEMTLPTLYDKYDYSNKLGGYLLCMNMSRVSFKNMHNT